VGRLHVGLSGRRPPSRRRRGSEQLASLRTHAGPGERRRHGRRRLRPLSPLPVRRRFDAETGTDGLPLQHLLEPDSPGGARHREPPGSRLLPPPRGRARRRRHPPVCDAFPLGSAGGARGSRRLAQPGDRRLVRRLRARRLPGARARRRVVGDLERAVGGHGRRLSPRKARSGPSQPVRTPDRGAQPPARPWGGSRGGPRGGSPESRHRREYRAEVRGLAEPGGPGGHPPRRSVHEPSVPRSDLPGGLSGRNARDLRKGVAALSLRRFRRDSTPDRFPRRQLLHPRCDAERPGSLAVESLLREARGRSSRRPDGRSSRAASSTRSSG